MAKKKEYFKVPHGWGNQHGTDIIPCSKEEYDRAKEDRSLLWSASYFDSYIAALYYTQD